MVALVACFSSSAFAYNMVCPANTIKTEAKLVKDINCRSQVAVLYGINNGRCLTQDSLATLAEAQLNKRYQVCLKEYPGLVGGNYVASIESLGQDLDSGIVYE